MLFEAYFHECSLAAKPDPCVGFASSLLWVKDLSGPYLRMFLSRRELNNCRPGFPTWSIISEIFNKGCREKSIFGACLRASKDISARSDAYIQFWLYSEGQPAALHQLVQKHSSNVLPEDLPCLLVEDDLVRVKVNNSD